jgi:hypothetical protein
MATPENNAFKSLRFMANAKLWRAAMGNYDIYHAVL